MENTNTTGTANAPIENVPPQPKLLTVSLSLEEWDLLIEMLEIIPKPMMRLAAINIIRPQLVKQIEEKK